MLNLTYVTRAWVGVSYPDPTRCTLWLKSEYPNGRRRLQGYSFRARCAEAMLAYDEIVRRLPARVACPTATQFITDLDRAVVS